MALGAGFVEGIGLGDNSKAAIIRLGLVEMRRFIQARDRAASRGRAASRRRPCGTWGGRVLAKSRLGVTRNNSDG